LLLFFVTGCSVAPVATKVSGTGSQPNPPTPNRVVVKGEVHGGQQPIIGASVYLFAVSTTGAKQGSTSLLLNTADTHAGTWGYYVPTNSTGGFSIAAGDYACSQGQQVYLYSLGGNAGFGINSASGLMAVVGLCGPGNSFPNLPPTVEMNEVTTVAAAYALAGFATDAAHISGANTATATTGMANAALGASNLASPGSGQALTTTPAGNGSVPQSEIDTLANILSSCINSDGPSSGACSTLLSNATSNGMSSGTQPTDTASAAINIAHNPGANVGNLYPLSTPTAPFQPSLDTAPNDWTIAVTYSGGGLAGPTNVAIDSSGDVWVVNSNNAMSEFVTATGNFYGQTSLTGIGLSSPWGLAIDASNNVWVTNHGTQSITEVAAGSGTSDTGGGLNNSWAIAIDGGDGSGHVWVANHGNSSISEFNPATGSAISGAGGDTGGGVNDPIGIATDGAGNVWIGNNGGSSLSEFDKNGNAIGSGFTGGGVSAPVGVAVDAAGNVWTSNSGNNSISRFNPNTSTFVSGGSGYSGGGLNVPYGLAIDGSGNVWTANQGGNTISEFNASSGTFVTGPGGYQAESPTPLSGPQGIAIDGTGNVWVANDGGNDVTEFVGAASPVAGTPLVNELFNLAITTTSLPNGSKGTPYSATLQAADGTKPYTWSQTGGSSLSTWGLALNASTGAITGTPTTTATNAALTFTVKDSSSPQQSQSVNLTLTITATTGMTVSVSPRNSGITVNQTLSLTPTTNDPNGVNWSASGTGCMGTGCGTFSAGNTANGVAVVYTPPATPGAYSITATSASESSVIASVNVGVTNLAGVYTYHTDNNRDGANTQEYALTTSNVTTGKFGKLYACATDSPIYTQPLWVANLTVSSAKHNVVFVATTNDSLYAFDGDNPGSSCTSLWKANLLDTAHGGTPGEAPVPAGTSGALVGQSPPAGDIEPTVGVIGTPVIDSSTNTLYVVSKSYVTTGPTFYQRLHAIDITTGNEKFSGPANITSSITFPCQGTNCSTPAFNPQYENQRCGLALGNDGTHNIVYVTWASHEDAEPYYGWVVGFNAGTLAAEYVFNDVPDHNVSDYGAGIWMSGAAPAIDSSGNLYLITGNGLFDANSTSKPHDDYGDSLLKLAPNLTVSQYFTPSDESSDNSDDNDFGSGGATVLVDLPSNGGNPTHLMMGGGKNSAGAGNFYVLNRDSLGGSGDSNAWQQLSQADSIFAIGTFWNYNYYLGMQFEPVMAWTLSPSTAKLTAVATGTSNTFIFPGTSPSISASGTTNGILWAQDNSQYCTSGSPGCGAAVLYAYDATNLATTLWSSSTGTGLGGISNAAGHAMKFTIPTVANGKVYVSTRGTGTETDTTVGELEIYGLLP